MTDVIYDENKGDYKLQCVCSLYCHHICVYCHHFLIETWGRKRIESRTIKSRELTVISSSGVKLVLQGQLAPAHNILCPDPDRVGGVAGQVGQEPAEVVALWRLYRKLDVLP